MVYSVYNEAELFSKPSNMLMLLETSETCFVRSIARVTHTSGGAQGQMVHLLGEGTHHAGRLHGHSVVHGWRDHCTLDQYTKPSTKCSVQLLIRIKLDLQHWPVYYMPKMVFVLL